MITVERINCPSCEGRTKYLDPMKMKWEVCPKCDGLGSIDKEVLNVVIKRKRKSSKSEE